MLDIYTLPSHRRTIVKLFRHKNCGPDIELEFFSEPQAVECIKTLTNVSGILWIQIDQPKIGRYHELVWSAGKFKGKLAEEYRL